MISDALVACRLALPQLTMEKEQEEREECFFSKESSLESALVAIETLGEFDPSSSVNPDSLLTVFGLHGLAIRHRPGNYTDPMLMGLNQGLGDTIHQFYTISASTPSPRCSVIPPSWPSWPSRRQAGGCGGPWWPTPSTGRCAGSGGTRTCRRCSGGYWAAPQSTPPTPCRITWRFYKRFQHRFKHDWHVL